MIFRCLVSIAVVAASHSSPLMAQNANPLECLAEESSSELTDAIYDDFISRQGTGNMPDDLGNNMMAVLQSCFDKQSLSNDKIQAFAGGNIGFMLLGKGRERLAKAGVDVAGFDKLIESKGWTSPAQIEAEFGRLTAEEQMALFSLDENALIGPSDLLAMAKLHVIAQILYRNGLSGL